MADIDDLQSDLWNEEDLGPNRCAICEKRTWGAVNGVPHYLCVSHYTEYGHLLLGPTNLNNAWLRFLLNGEKQRRKKRGKYFKKSKTLLAMAY